MARRADKSAEDTRQSILDGSFSLFGLRGLDGVSISQLARRCAITTGTLYWHFKDKEAIYLECLKELRRRLDRALIAPLQDEGDAVQRLMRFFSGLSDLCADTGEASEMAGFIYQIGVSELPEVIAFRTSMDAWLQGSIAAFLADGREEGAFEFKERPHAYARLMLTIVEGSLLAARRGDIREIIDVLNREAVFKTIGVKAQQA